MRFSYLLSLASALGAVQSRASAQEETCSVPRGEARSTAGLTKLLERRLPNHVQYFNFNLVPSSKFPGSVFNSSLNSSAAVNDCYSVTSNHGKFVIEGNSLSALASG